MTDKKVNQDLLKEDNTGVLKDEYQDILSTEECLTEEGSKEKRIKAIIPEIKIKGTI